MKNSILVVLVTIFTIAAVPTKTLAATLDFNFSFTNVNNGGGTVTGIIRGLENNSIGEAASVEILSNTDGFGVGLYSGAPSARVFGVTNSVLDFASFVSQGGVSPDGFVQDSSFRFGVNSIGLTNSSTGINSSAIILSNLVVTPVPAAVPILGSMPLLVSGIAVGGILLRRRKQRSK